MKWEYGRLSCEQFQNAMAARKDETLDFNRSYIVPHSGEF
jgi:hypothetical protein